MNDITVPQKLGAPYQVFWFEEDDISIGSIALSIYIIDGTWLSFFASIGICWLYYYFKKKYPKSFLKHMLYFSGLMSIKSYPTTFQNEFNE